MDHLSVTRTAPRVHRATVVVAMAVTISAASGPGVGAWQAASGNRPDGGPQRSTIAERLSLRVVNVRLVEPPELTPQPAALLRFELVNEGLLPVTDITLRIEVHERSQLERGVPPKVLVKSFDVRGAATIEAGFTVEYSVLFRNLVPACECEATVEVISATVAGNRVTPTLPTSLKGDGDTLGPA